MPLNMSDFLPKDEEIIDGDKKFVVTANLPKEVIKKITGMVKNEKKEIEDPYEYLANVVKSVLYVKNKKEEVDKWIENLGSLALTKIAEFITAYVQNCMDTKKNPEKKN